MTQFPIVALVLVAVLALLIGPGLVAGRWARHRRGRRDKSARIRVIGVGGAGGNIVSGMVEAGLPGVDLIACNTDAQALRESSAWHQIRIGRALTAGLGAGGDPSLGQRAAEDDAPRIADALRGSDLVFVMAGLGGGTGSGAAPVVARIARESGALTVGAVTMPFDFEGTQRQRVATAAIEELRPAVDALVTIPNDRVSGVVDPGPSVMDAFQAVNDALLQAVQGVIDIITVPGLVNLDFADVRAVMKDGGLALIGVGRATGEGRAVAAARQAISSPLLNVGMDGARAILFVIAGSASLGLAEVTRAAEEIRRLADPEANLIFGTCLDEGLGEDVLVTVIATGLRAQEGERSVLEVPAQVTAASDTAGANGHLAPPEPRRRRGREAPARARLEPDVAMVVASGARAGQPSASAVPLVDPDDLDIPAFLRRRPSEA